MDRPQKDHQVADIVGFDCQIQGFNNYFLPETGEIQDEFGKVFNYCVRMLKSSLHSFLGQLLKAKQQFLVGNFKIGSDFYLKLADGVEEPENVGFDIGAEAFLFEGDVDQQHQESLELLAGESVDLLVRLH